MIALILSITVHEFGHAFVADRLGDRLPRSQGRVTLNPLSHIDPLGTLGLPLFGTIFGIGAIGWGRPVQIQPLSFTRKLRMKTGHLLVAIAGPAMNILFAIVITVALVICMRTGVLNGFHPVARALASAIYLNFILAFFNLLPVPPLDGGAVLAGILPDRSSLVEFLQRYGAYIVIALFILPRILRVYFAYTADPVFNGWMSLVGLVR
jgi:Zn-dependent protease